MNRCTCLYRMVCLTVTAVILVSCSSDDAGTDIAPEPTWDIGPITTHVVPSEAYGTVSDSTTGVTLLFPEGGTGTVSIAEIITPASAPGIPGRGFMIDHAGSGDMRLLALVSGGDQPVLLGHSEMDGLFDQEGGGRAGWHAVAWDKETEDLYAFLLTMPFELGKKAQTRRKIGSKYYWYSQISATSSEAETRMNLSLQSAVFVDVAIDAMSSALGNQCRTRATGTHRRRMEYDGAYYKGFWWRSLGPHGRRIMPTVHVPINVTSHTLAHETGHYVVHLMVGDDVQSALEGQSPLLTDHGWRKLMGRGYVVEDYAYYLQHLMTGEVEGVHLQTPYDVLRDLWKEANDMPSHEGFTACLLANLSNTSTVIREYKFGSLVPVPVIGLSEADVCDVIARGATDLDQLVKNISSALGTKADALSVLCQRLGWAYTVRGRFVDTNGQPLSGLQFRNVITHEGKTYEAGVNSGLSDADGNFLISQDVFPGSSILRVSNGQNSVDVPISIAWEKHTTESIALGDIVINFQPDLLSLLKQCNVVEIHTEELWQEFGWPYNDSGTQMFNMRQDMVPLPSWTGPAFAETWTSSVDGSKRTIDATFSANGRTLTRFRSYYYHQLAGTTTVYEKDIVLTNLPVVDINWDSSEKRIRFIVRGKICEQHAEKFHRVLSGDEATVKTTYSDKTVLSIIFSLE